MVNVLVDAPALSQSTIALSLKKHFGDELMAFNMESLLALDPDEIKGLEYDEVVQDPQDPTKTTIITKPLPKGRQSLITILQEFYQWRLTSNDSIEWNEWVSRVTIDDLGEFKSLRMKYARYPPPPTSSKGNTYIPLTPKEAFQKGIKRDTTIYPKLTKDSGYDDWYRSVSAKALLHDVGDVFDPNFVPIGNEATELFEEKKIFVYSMLQDTLHTDKGKTLIRQHGKDRDAQKLLQKLVKYYTNSAASDIQARNILTYLTTARIGTPDSPWKGTYASFINHWVDKARLYMECIQGTTTTFSDQQKQTFLRTTTRPTPTI